MHAGGVYSWSSGQPDAFRLLLPSSLHGGTCESLALSGSLVAASFRAPLAAAAAGGQQQQPQPPAHVLSRLALDAAEPGSIMAGMASGQAAADGGSSGAAPLAVQQQLMQRTLRLAGHSSKATMTRGCFLPLHLPGLQEQLVFASADEASCQPRLWGCSSGRQLQQGWWPHPSPVLQLSGGCVAGPATGVQQAAAPVLLGALSEQHLKLYDWQSGQC